VLYLTDNHVSRAASAKIAAWVKAGGKLFATAGAGQFDEYNQPNKSLRELLGVDQTELVKPDAEQVHFIKQDLRFVKPLGEVTLADPAAKFPVFGAVSKFKPAADAKINGTFAGGAPAVTVRQAGQGEAVYCGFLPGLSYFHPATPLQPLDRGSSDDAMAHFLPTAFDWNVGNLVGAPAAGTARPIVASEKLIECSVIESPTGTAIMVVNWSGKPIRGLTLTATIPVPAKAELASGGKITATKEGNATIFTFDMDVSGDVVILRK
jgi:hypothetical protein